MQSVIRYSGTGIKKSGNCGNGWKLFFNLLGEECICINPALRKYGDSHGCWDLTFYKWQGEDPHGLGEAFAARSYSYDL